MAKRKNRERGEADLKLKQPDRTGPSEKTLLELAQERQLFQQADEKIRANARRPRRQRGREQGEGREKGDEDGAAGLSPLAEQLLETVLWTVSLAMLHFTLDTLVQHQYAVDISWPGVAARAAQAFFVFSLLFYSLHQHASDPTLIRGLPARLQKPLRQAVFFAASVCAGCYLIFVTNRHGYLAVMRRAPPLGCLWIWSVIELELPLAVLSLACAGGYMWQGGYGVR